MNNRLISFLFIITILFVDALFPQSTSGQNKSNGEQIGIPWRGEQGITESVADIIARDKAASVNKTFAIRPRGKEYEGPEKTQMNPLAPAVSEWPPLSEKQRRDQLTQILSPQTVGVNFLGVEISETPGYIPPDCNGDVGPTQILIHVNGRVKVFDKTGVPGGLDADDNDDEQGDFGGFRLKHGLSLSP